MPQEPVIREAATTTKVRMAFDASAKPHYLESSINDCMHKGHSLLRLLWDILLRARMSPNLLIRDTEKAFLQKGIKVKDKDAFPFLFTLEGREEPLDLQEYHWEPNQAHLSCVQLSTITMINMNRTSRTQQRHRERIPMSTINHWNNSMWTVWYTRCS